MGFTSLATKKPKRGFASLDTVEGLVAKADESGLGVEARAVAEETPGLSFLQRLGKGLGAFNPAEAILTGTEKGAGAGLLEYPKSILKGVGSAITGTDYEGERRSFADAAEKFGVENSIAKFGIGFAGDVLLDPTTYFGGAIAKGLGIAAKGASGVALKGVGRVAPDVETGLRLAGTGLQDALGRAFQYAYKASKGAKEDVLTFLSKEQRAKLGLAASNLDRLGTGVLTPAQREELALKMIAGKRAEFVARETGEAITPQVDESLEPLAQEARKYKSAEEFVESQQQVFRGGTKFDVAKMNAEGTPFTVDNKVAEQFARIKNQFDAGPVGQVLGKSVGQNITEKFYVSSNAKIATRTDIPDDIFNAYKQANPLTKPHIAEPIVNNWAKTNGFDGIDYRTLGKTSAKEAEIKILNPAVLKTKSQLTDFYNQAVKGVGKTPAEIARETALKDTSSGVAEVIESQITRSRKFGESVTENPYEVYFPFIKKDKLQKFVNETKGIKVGSEGYRKQFKNLLTNENIELDPAKAFFTREAQIVSDRMTRDFLGGFVKKYGKGLDEFANSDEAARAGYQLIKEKGIFGKELGYVGEFDAKLIRDSISPEFQTVNMLAKATGFDAVTSLFKRSVTGLFAPFHVRNFVSGNIQNFEVLGVDAFNPKNIKIGQKIAYLMGKGDKIPAGEVNIGGKTMKFSDVMKPFVDRFSGDTFYNADFDMALKSGTELKSVAGLFSGQRMKETVKTVGLGQEAIPFKIGRAIGQFIEHQQKATAYVTALNQGKNIDEALRLAEAAGFDYRALTKFESQILRRIIPFYSFTRKNIELQLKTLGENPQRINQVISFFENVTELGGGLTEDERQSLPDYLKEQLILSFGKNLLGQPIVAGGFGTPVEQPGQAVIGKGIGDSIRRIAASLNPLIKTPLEKAFGKDFFQNRPLEEVVDAKQYQILPDFLKEFIGFREIEKKDKNGKAYTAYTADPEKLHILRNLPTTRLFGYLYEIYRPEEETVPGAKTLNLISGVKPKPIDLETVEYFRDRDKRRELEDLLIRAGVLKEFQKVYAPKK